MDDEASRIAIEDRDLGLLRKTFGPVVTADPPAGDRDSQPRQHPGHQEFRPVLCRMAQAEVEMMNFNLAPARPQQVDACRVCTLPFEFWRGRT